MAAITWSAVAAAADSGATSKLSSSTVTPPALSPSSSTMRTVFGAIDTPSTTSTAPPHHRVSLDVSTLVRGDSLILRDRYRCPNPPNPWPPPKPPNPWPPKGPPKPPNPWPPKGPPKPPCPPPNLGSPPKGPRGCVTGARIGGRAAGTWTAALGIGAGAGGFNGLGTATGEGNWTCGFGTDA